MDMINRDRVSQIVESAMGDSMMSVVCEGGVGDRALRVAAHSFDDIPRDEVNRIADLIRSGGYSVGLFGLDSLDGGAYWYVR